MLLELMIGGVYSGEYFEEPLVAHNSKMTHAEECVYESHAGCEFLYCILTELTAVRDQFLTSLGSHIYWPCAWLRYLQCVYWTENVCYVSGNIHVHVYIYIYTWVSARKTYRKTCSISCTKSHNLNVSNLVLQLSLFNPLKPGVKSRMKV